MNLLPREKERCVKTQNRMYFVRTMPGETRLTPHRNEIEMDLLYLYAGFSGTIHLTTILHHYFLLNATEPELPPTRAHVGPNRQPTTKNHK